MSLRQTCNLPTHSGAGSTGHFNTARVPQEIEDAIIALAIEQPAFGQVCVAS
jgi:hypothetical protein